MMKYNKAIVAILGGLVTLAAAFGLDVEWASEELIASIGTVLTSVLVYAVPNIGNDNA